MKDKILKIYKEKSDYVIERTNQFNHTTKRRFATTEGVKEALDHFINSGIIHEYKIIVEDEKLLRLVVHHIGEN